MSRWLLACSLVCAALTGQVAAGDAPTTERVLAALRQAAAEDGSREPWLEVARFSGAAEDYVAAAEAPVPDGWDGVTRLRSDREVAEGLAASGDAARAADLLRAALDRPLTLGEPHVPVTEPDYRQSARVVALSQAAETLYPLDPEGAVSALVSAQQILAEMGQADSTLRREALGAYLRALALHDPSAAWEQAVAEFTPTHIPISGRLVLNMMQADPGSVMPHLDEMLRGGALAFRHPLSPDAVKGLVAAHLFGTDPRQALDLAIRYELHKAPDIAQQPPLEPLARQVAAGGVAELPLDAEYRPLYVRLARDLARMDYEAAVGLALALGDARSSSEALASICGALAATDPPAALDAAWKLAELHDAGGTSDDALRDAAAALVASGEQVVAELLARVDTPWMLPDVFGAWWLHDPTAAEALLPELGAFLQPYAIMGILAHGPDAVAAAAGSDLAQWALDSPALGRDPFASGQVIMLAAPFAPETARTAWQRLEALDVAGADERAVRWHLDALLTLAEAFERRQTGSSRDEVAEIERILDAAGPDAAWVPLYRARLAGIYAWHDAALAGQSAEQLIAGLGGLPASARPADVLSEATVVLSRVDRPRATELMRDRQDLRGNLRLFEQTAAGIARWQPAWAAEMLEEVGEVRGDYGFPGGVIGLLCRDAPEETVLTFLAARLDLAPRELPHAPGADEALMTRGYLAAGVLTAVLPAERPFLASAVLEHLVAREEDEVVTGAVTEARGSLALLSDEVLHALLARLQTMDAGAARPALAPVIAASAARDWDGSEALLASLAAGERMRALLMVPGMVRYRESLPAELRGR